MDISKIPPIQDKIKINAKFENGRLFLDGVDYTKYYQVIHENEKQVIFTAINGNKLILNKLHI